MYFNFPILSLCGLLLLSTGLRGGASGYSLADAAQKADGAAIRNLLAGKADVNAVQPDGTTALHWAAYRDDVETARLLVRAGSTVNAANRYGQTALALACVNGNLAMVDLLLESGADPNGVLPGGETVLMTAARTGKPGPVKALLATGADVQGKESRRGQNALMWAAAEGHSEVVAVLLQAGAHVHARLDSGLTPLLIAVREGQIEVVRTLLQAGANVNEVVAPFEASGPRPASGAGAPRAGNSALHLAVVNGHFELAGMLLDAGANPNAAGPGYAVLHTISWVRKPGGGDNDPAPRGSGATSSLDLVKKLIASGANPDIRMAKKLNVGLTGLNTLGATPFLLAARTADAELMRLLASLGADTRLTNADNATPLMVAAGLGTRSPGEDAGTEREVVEAVQAAIELGGDVNAVDNNGETAMHGAAYKNLPAVVELLADKGAKIEVWNQKNKHGWTPLIIAEGHRFGNFKPSAVTVAALEKVMVRAGVAPPNARPTRTGKNSEYVRMP